MNSFVLDGFDGPQKIFFIGVVSLSVLYILTIIVI